MFIANPTMDRSRNYRAGFGEAGEERRLTYSSS
jgi:hypothetical protein